MLSQKLCSLKYLLFVLLLGTVGFGSSGCRRAGEPNEPAQAVSVLPAHIAGGGSADAVVRRILSGDFSGACAICPSPGTGADGRLSRPGVLLDRYEAMQTRRQQGRQKALAEQLAEIEKLAPKLSAKVAEVNDIDQTLSAAARAWDCSGKEQKQQVLDRPDVKKAIEQAMTRGQEFESRGRWMDAYSHCYYWLSLLYGDNKAYKDKAKELTELASVELALQDDGCGQTALERYKGVEPAMFLRAVQELERNYVKVIDFPQMARKGLARCRILGRVLAESQEKLAWKVSAEQVQKWQTGIADIEAGLDEKTGNQPAVLAMAFDKALSLDGKTLELPQEVVIAQFAEASFDSLDPYTNLVWPWFAQDFEKMMTQQFSGIGVEISKTGKVLKIGSLLPDTPAYRAGLDADDEILAVNGESTEPMTIFCAVSKITGPRGTKVKLSIRRPSTGKVWDATIARDRIVVQPLRGWRRNGDGQWDYLLDPVNRIGYVRVTSFTESTGPDLDEALKKLEKGGLNGLILDLRYNSGGYLESARDVVDLFVSEGIIVKSSPRRGLASYEIAHRRGTHPDYPLVVLINEGSASASEIVAGALQDVKHKRATLVGQRSYGKGSVQVVSSVTGGGSQFKYTIAYYHLPSDQPVANRYQVEKEGRKDWGIAPDVDVELSVNELREMLDVQRDNDVLFRANRQDGVDEGKRHTLAATLDSDPQLAVALLVTQAKMLDNGFALKLSEPAAGAVAATIDEVKH